ncbi:MAG TPA: hypothetical protein VFN64_11190, partial [Burkholderiaceae bacterium]|nr:hypothetical protein [Burkholderiaceae bacterium]
MPATHGRRANVQVGESETAGRPLAGRDPYRALIPERTLAQQLAAAERSKKWRAFLLTAPLLLFLLLTFLGPIGALLSRSVVDTEFAAALPNVAREIRRWDGRALPDEATFAALITDVRAARAADTLAPAATRLNYDISGFRSLLFTTG